MIRKAPKRIYAALLLLILIAAYAGHKVHIYKEDPAHFAALCGDLLPDNGAHQIWWNAVSSMTSISSPISTPSGPRTRSIAGCWPS